MIAETEEGLMIIDQHAAHERVRFEALCKSLASAQPAKQNLLMDEIIKLSPHQGESLREQVPFLERLGFDIDEFGESTFVVRSVPHLLADEQTERLIKNYLEEIEEGKVKTGLETHEEEIAAMVACKRQSIRAYDSLSILSIKMLLDQLSQCDNPFSCPHGRPTLLNYSFEDLERQFKRKL